MSSTIKGFEELAKIDAMDKERIKGVAEEQFSKYGVDKFCSMDFLDSVEQLVGQYGDLFGIHTFKFITPLEISEEEFKEDVLMHLNMFAKDNKLNKYYLLMIAPVQTDEESRVFMALVVEVK